MYPLPGGGFIIDTPGIKEFGLIDFEKSEICERFPEMRALMSQCRYANCTHTHEPDCAVKLALDKGQIPLFRYENYLGMLANEDYK
jgi:ribosome biogenesis GTPase